MKKEEETNPVHSPGEHSALGGSSSTCCLGEACISAGPSPSSCSANDNKLVSTEQVNTHFDRVSRDKE